QVLSSAAIDLEAAAKTLTSSASDVANRTAEVTVSSKEAASSVQTVAAATEELATSVSEINQQVEGSTKITVKAVDEARQTIGQVSRLTDAAKTIDGIVSLIDEIARRTNLLALNATIEAAHAGDVGKGFAVVAAEVKQLADQTGKAIAEISAQI